MLCPRGFLSSSQQSQRPEKTPEARAQSGGRTFVTKRQGEVDGMLLCRVTRSKRNRRDGTVVCQWEMHSRLLKTSRRSERRESVPASIRGDSRARRRSDQPRLAPRLSDLQPRPVGGLVLSRDFLSPTNSESAACRGGPGRPGGRHVVLHRLLGEPWGPAGGEGRGGRKSGRRCGACGAGRGPRTSSGSSPLPAAPHLVPLQPPGRLLVQPGVHASAAASRSRCCRRRRHHLRAATAQFRGRRDRPSARRGHKAAGAGRRGAGARWSREEDTLRPGHASLQFPGAPLGAARWTSGVGGAEPLPSSLKGPEVNPLHATGIH